MIAVRVEPGKGFLLRNGSKKQYYNTSLGENIAIKIIGHDKEGNNLGFIAVNPSTSILREALENFDRQGLKIELSGGDITEKSINAGQILSKFFKNMTMGNVEITYSINGTPHYDEVIFMGEDLNT